MNDLLPILTGLIVISALAVVASDNKKEDSKDKGERKVEYKEKEKAKDKKDKDKDKDKEFKKLWGYFQDKLSKKKKPKRFHKVYSQGKTKRNSRGKTEYELRTVSK
jgi:FtsZ-interacting cell division protein ZipA